MLVRPAWSGTVFTTDSSIGVNDTNYDGQDIVVIGCTLTIDGPHAFSDVVVVDNGVLTHSFSSNGLLANPLNITGELQRLTGTNFLTLANMNVVAGTVVVMGIDDHVTYTNGIDYVLIPGSSGETEIARLPGSAIPDGGPVSVSYQADGPPFSAGLNLTVANNVVIEAGSMILADGDGFGPELGTGAGASLSSDYPFGPPFYYTTGGGGGFGGDGAGSFGGAAGGDGYGSITAPDEPGSGGGTGVGPGGAGGGSIKLVIGGALVADGSISANGSAGTNDGSGGGSGGGIWLSAPTVSGAGSISANGGAGESGFGGGGGGGRIAILCGTNDFAGTFSAHGGTGAFAGGAGTVFLQGVANTNGQLVVDNRGQPGANTHVIVPFGADLTISGGATATLTAVPSEIGNLLVASNSWFLTTTDQTLLTVTGNATIQPGGGISADAQGGGEGEFGGGGYGGNGGASTNSNYEGGAFGSVTDPTSPGRGGGWGEAGDLDPGSHGGAGGGAIHLNVGGTLNLGGAISANGGAGVGLTAGGGSGGGVLVNAAALSGGGTISANGGAASDQSGGGGGGGRIAVYSRTNQFSGRMFAFGGAGGVGGGAGTIFTQLAGNSVSQLLVDNGGFLGAITPLSTLAGLLYDVTITNGAVAALSGTSFTAHNLAVGSNSLVVVTPLELPAPLLQLSLTGDATILAGGAIVMDNEGYTGGAGPGAGRLAEANGVNTGSGGSHGGTGGSSLGGAPGGIPYGSLTAPVEAGSGGGNGAGTYPSNLGGTGGGAVQLIVTRTLMVNGRISANGGPGLAQGSGGGSGGSISLTAQTFTGSGKVSANGGAGAYQFGGGGGGGRIAVFSATNQFTGTISAYGGPGFIAGGAGTILNGSNMFVGTILLDNGGLNGATTALGALNSSLYSLTIANGADVTVSASAIQLQNLLIASNGSLTQGSNSGVGSQIELNISGNATIQPGGALVADGGGASGGAGSGAGRSVTVNGIVTGGGGGFGGPGGAGANGAAGGASYGLVNYSEAGSGGGNGENPLSPSGGAGGGVIVLNVTGTLSINGRISANGLPGAGQGSGGGSGGGIAVSAGVVSGGGAITANGGSGQLPLGGGGGGGRIQLIARTNSLFTGNVSAHGGPGFVGGGAGTIFSELASGNYPQVVLDNGGATGAATPLAAIANSDLVISGGTVVTPLANSPAIRNLLIASNSFIRPTNAVALQWTITGNATIQAGGGINVDGIANGSASPGAGSTGTSTGGEETTGSGGGYGGDGGGGASGTPGGGSYGSILQPFGFGSPGGAGTAQRVAGGGGVVNLTVFGHLQLDGTISANGTGATNGHAGGGSGGSIQLTSGTFAGTGVARADGGSGHLPWGGGGGGGRIAVYSSTNYSSSNQFLGSLSAYGGAGFVGGGAGTIFTLCYDTNGVEQLVVDNGGLIGTNTPLGGDDPYLGLTVTGGAIGQVGTLNSNLLVRSLLVASNASITHLSANGNVSFTVMGNATVQSNASISADGRGYAGAARGPGAGQTGSNGDGSGAGYGGQGGASASGAPGGATYGSSQEPTDWGSAGGFPYGYAPDLSQGGGAIILNVTGTLTVNGSLTANGMPALFEGAGGGAGGSIWLTASALTGNGVITANGGAGEPTTGGGGGGGRIALYSGTDTFSGSVAALGATGASPGQNGTLFQSTLPATQVVSQAPSGVIFTGTNSVTLFFNSPLAWAALDSANLTVVGPAGPLPSVTAAVSTADSRQLAISFPQQSASGDYVIQFGPQITNLYGFPMTAPYLGTFTIANPAVPLSVAVGQQSTNLNLHWDAVSGVNYQLQSSTNLIDWQCCGAALQGCNGPMNVALPVGSEPGLFFRLAPAVAP